MVRLVAIGIVVVVVGGCSLLVDSGNLVRESGAPDASATDSDSIALDAAPGAEASADVSVDTKIVDPNLVGEWLFDEGTGNIARDTSGHGYDAVLRGSAKLAGAVLNRGNSLALDGEGDAFVEALGGEKFPKTGTLSLWVLSEKPADDAYLGPVFDGWDSTRQHLYVRRGSRWEFSMMGPGDQYAYFQYFDPPAQKWFRMEFTWDEGAKHGSLYLDGRPTLEGTYTYDFSPHEERVVFGGGFIGRIDDVRLYDRVLSAVEIAALK